MPKSPIHSARAPRRHSAAGRVAVACALLFLVASLAATADSGAPRTATRTVVWGVLVCLTGAAWWLRRRDRAAFERALAREAAARAVAEDRLEIARDLHDAVSGALGAIMVRAAVAQRLEHDPQDLRVALKEVEQASHEATAGLLRMLRVLHGEGSPGSAVPVSPPAGADREDADAGDSPCGTSGRAAAIAGRRA
ncbi:histidine kinase dimerization/phosphoacceptor domain-containing protein [Actinomyces ruminicola]|uniref:histidine kinase dimerization/phosphoacceptor domain-containing protein n=1 Tax=Actinomyces ruminicola TaxID=332524 RepID=UPI0021C319F2|nr:histidine kinase dimerization/phosphoacceptor domain-containing protein [Actinomyces ruminicola]